MTEFAHPLFEWVKGADAVVTVTMNDPDQSANTMNDRFRAEFDVLVDHLYAERDTLTGVVLTSAKKTFLAGGDLAMLMRATPEQAPEIRTMLDRAKSSLRRLETLGRPVVAVISGAALGGGLELAFACHHRVAVDAPGTIVGFPEVTLGLLPGGGGIVRSVRRFGLLAALQDLLLTGKRFAPADAFERGLVDQLAPDRDAAMATARTWIAANPEPVQPWDRKGYAIPGGTPATPAVARALPGLPAALRAKSHGAPVSAQASILAAAVEGAQVDFDGALTIESRYCTDLICGKVSGNIIKSMFYDLQSINRGATRPKAVPPHRASKVVVLGAGMMGAGIAYVSAKAGLDVILKDVSIEAAERGKAYSARVLAKAVGRGTVTTEVRAEILARIQPAVDPAAAAGADLVIEAVFEDPALKQRVLNEVLPHLADDAVIASNTSTLPITGLAGGLPQPEQFIGTHFFSPVDRMGLVEIVVGDKTSDTTLAKTIDIARQIGKTPIVVNDSRGFFTSRVISEFLDEAIALVGEGAPAASVEQAAMQAGYPVGALALLDEIGLPLNRKIREQTTVGSAAQGATVTDHPAARVVDRMLDELDRPGRAAGAGFYDYLDGKKVGLSPALKTAFGGENTAIPFADIQERMLFAESLDAVRCLDEGVLRSIADANVGSILGIGFPAWTGGVLQYINQYNGGPAGFVARAHVLAQRYGDRFTPPASLVVLAHASREYV